MSVSLDAYLASISDAENPRAEIKKWVGNLKDIKLVGDRVMVATYARPQKTAGNVILPDSQLAENRWQGMVGLLVAKGPTAWRYDGSYAFEGDAPKIFDWVVYKPAEGTEIGWRKCSCRILRSESIIAKISDPLLIY